MKHNNFYKAGFEFDKDFKSNRQIDDNDPRAVETTTSPVYIPNLTEQRLTSMIKEAMNNAPVDNGFEYANWLAHYIITHFPEFKVNPALGYIPAGALEFYGTNSINEKKLSESRKEASKLEEAFPVGDNEKQWRENHK